MLRRTRVGERLIHGLHAVFSAGLHGGGDLVDLAFPDEVTNRRGGDHDLDTRHASFAVPGGKELLGDNRLNGGCQLDPHLILLMRGEYIDDPVDRLRGILGVQGGEDEVTGFCGSQCRRDGLEVAKLTNQNDVGILPQGVAQCLIEPESVELPPLAD